MKIREIYNELKKKEQDELRKIFNVDAFKLIQSYINDCRSGIEKILLDLIELVAEHGVQMYYLWSSSDPIFKDIQRSGFINKIEQMIKIKVENEKEQKKYSNETEQLIRIYAQIMKGRESSQQMIDISAQVIEKNITNLFNIINKLKEDSKVNNNEINYEEDEREIKQSAELIKVIPLIGEKYRISGQIMKIVKERICPLIHLNCPPDINCQQCINIPQSPAIIEFKSVVFQTLTEVSSEYNKEFKDILVNGHNIIPHLTHPLIQFASQYQFKKETNSQKQNIQQQSEQSTFISFIISTLNILDNLINRNNDNSNISKQVIKTPNVLHSLLTLTRYKLNIHFTQENDELTLSVRSSSRNCLWYIHLYGDATVQTELVNARYARVLVIAISTASGHGENQDNEINKVLFYISRFLRYLHQGKGFNAYLQSSFPPQHLLAQISNEQIEEEGANEEIDSQLINNGKNGDNKYMANEAKGKILNFFIDSVNPKPDWYN